LGEVFVISGSILFGMPLPLVAVQIIWLNFITDGFFVIALAQDPPTERYLAKRSDVECENLIDQLIIRRSLLMSAAMFLATVPIFYVFSKIFTISYSRTMTLLVLSQLQWFNALNVRSRTKSIFSIGLTFWFIAAFISVVVLQYLAIETPLGNKLLHTENLRPVHWLLAVVAATLIIWVEEVRKFYARGTKGEGGKIIL
jgi:Ca2+-transporting ATPase